MLFSTPAMVSLTRANGSLMVQLGVSSQPLAPLVTAGRGIDGNHDSPAAGSARQRRVVRAGFLRGPGRCAGGIRHGLLDCPHYTRPAEFRDWKVPEVLLSGNHEQIRQWRRRQALEKTWRRRPDLLVQVPLSEEDRRWLDSLENA